MIKKVSANILVFNSKQELALQLRAAHDSSYPSHWDFSAAGGIDDGEQPSVAALRELKEELGITATIDFVEERTCTFPAWGTEELKEDHVYLYRTSYDGEFSPDPNEVQAVRFFRVGDIGQMMESGEKFHPEFRFFWDMGVIAHVESLFSKDIRDI